MTVGLKFYKRTLRKAPLKHTTVLVRVDYNVPIDKDGIRDDFRIRASLPTIERLLKDGCKVVLISHLGRPDGKVEPASSLEPVGKRLSELLHRPVLFVDDCVGVKVRMAVKSAPSKSVILLENLRFHAAEEANDSVFAQSLARDSGAQFFIQDGFGIVHRAHASTEAITRFLPSVAGLLLEKEWRAIIGAIKHPKRPLVAVIGGAKISDKLPVVDELVRVADQVLVGGAMANTLLAAKSYDMMASKREDNLDSEIRYLMQAVVRKVGSQYADSFLVLPNDVAVAKEVDRNAKRHEVMVGSLESGDKALDIGEHTMQRFGEAIRRAKTVIWNGTMGMAELPNFQAGSAYIAEQLASNQSIETVIGGGDTADFALRWDKKHGESFDHVSTGGGASLELMAGEKLPGIEALLDA